MASIQAYFRAAKGCLSPRPCYEVMILAYPARLAADDDVVEYAFNGHRSEFAR
jgi:hypothetical protein